VLRNQAFEHAVVTFHYTVASKALHLYLAVWEEFHLPVLTWDIELNHDRFSHMPQPIGYLCLLEADQKRQQSLE